MKGTIHDKQAWLDRIDAARIAAECTEDPIEDTVKRKLQTTLENMVNYSVTETLINN